MRFEAMIFQGTLEGILEHISQWKLSLSLSYSLTYIRESLSFMYKVLQVKWVPPQAEQHRITPILKATRECLEDTLQNTKLIVHLLFSPKLSVLRIRSEEQCQVFSLSENQGIIKSILLSGGNKGVKKELLPLPFPALSILNLKCEQ